MYTIKDIYYPGQIFRKEFHAGVKPSYDFAMTLKKMGANCMGLQPRMVKSVNAAHLLSAISARIAMLTMPRDKVVVFQYPNQSRLGKLVDVAKQRDCKIILMAHDIDEIRGYTNAVYDVLGKADVVIAHTPRMKEWIEGHFPQVKCVVLDIFDYIVGEENTRVSAYKKDNVVFAGNLEKSGFVGSLKKVGGEVSFRLYGKCDPSRLALSEDVVYEGCVDPELLPKTIASEGFGLVWDGDSVETCSGSLGGYLQYNAPYKASCYLAAGLPLVVWDKAGIADFVVSRGLGVAVKGIDELPGLMEKMSDREYKELRRNVREVGRKLNAGYFASRAISAAIGVLNEDSK